MIGRINKKLWAAIFTQRGKSIRIISVRRARTKEAALYEKEKKPKSAEEFDRRFNEGEDIHDLIQIRKRTSSVMGRKVRVTLDIAEGLLQEIGIRNKIRRGIEAASIKICA